MRSRRDFSRPHITSFLIKERNVARFVCAPPGYGKSAVACEYASVVFSFEHVFWFDAQSPCFVRDLDKRGFLAQLKAIDSHVALVVFEDVPLLSPDRAQRFSKIVDSLLKAGCEVLVTCTPSADVYDSLQVDRTVVGSVDLLLTDDELSRIHVAKTRGQNYPETDALAARIPGIAWNTAPDTLHVFLEGLASEELSGAVALAVYSMLLLGEADVAQLEVFSPQLIGLCRHLRSWYPHLGIDEAAGRFTTIATPVDEVVLAFRMKLAALVAASEQSDRNELAFRLADALLSRGNAQRALAVLDKVCRRSQRAFWVVGNARELARQACFAPTLAVTARMSRTRFAERQRLAVTNAFFLLALGDEKGAVAQVKNVAFDPSASVELQLAALALVMRADSSGLEERARAALVALVPQRRGDVVPSSFWTTLALGMQARSQGASFLLEYAQELFGQWERQERQGQNGAPAPFDPDAACLVASWVFGAYASVKNAEGRALDGRFASCIAQAERFVRTRLRAPRCGEHDYFAETAAIALEYARQRGLVLAEGALAANVLVSLRSLKLSLATQRAESDALQTHAAVVATTRLQTNPDQFLFAGSSNLDVRVKRTVPTLTVNLFGRLDVWIGDDQVPIALMRRKAVRELLVMLAVNLGREIPRDVVAEALWPESGMERARKNFYTVWSKLRQLLSLPDGTCPYLVKHAMCISLEPHYVHSDAKRLEGICRELQFGDVNLPLWNSMYREIDRDFAGELAPFECDNAVIHRARMSCKARMVDALTAAANRVVEEDDAQFGVWLARCAIAHDDVREDAYYILMKAQAALGQRTAAMDTYLACKKMLSERLGIAPSAETRAFYEGLLVMDRAA